MNGFECSSHCHLSFVAMATYHGQLPTVDWSLRISIALGGSVLASMKSDSKVDDLATCMQESFDMCFLAKLCSC